MSTIYSALHALGWTLIHSLWQGTIVAIIAVTFAATARSPKVRYWIYCAGLAAMMALTAFTFAEQMRTQIFRAPNLLSGVAIQFDSSTAAPATARSAKASSAPAALASTWSDAIAPICGALWLFGVVLMIARAIVAASFLRRLRKSAVRFTDQSWCLKVEQWARELGIRRTVSLCTTALNDVPAVIGHWKPMLLLPAALVAKLTPGQLEALILHELMHIRRNDFLVNLLQVACETLLCLHPAAWWLSAAIRREREHCCDDFASERAGRIPYAKALLELEELRHQLARELQIAANSGSLKHRVTRILSPVERHSWGGWLGVALVTLTAAGLFLAMPPKSIAQPAVAESNQAKSPFELRAVAAHNEPGETVLFAGNAGRNPGETLRVRNEVILNKSHVASAEVRNDLVSNSPEILIKLTDEGAARFSEFTRQNVGKMAAVIVNGQVVTAPIIQQQITGGSLAIAGNLDRDEAQRLLKSFTTQSTNSRPSSAVTFRAHFFRLPNGAAVDNSLLLPSTSSATAPPADPATGTAVQLSPAEAAGLQGDRASVRKISRVEAKNFLDLARASSNLRPLSAPAVTTLSGRSARIEVGAVSAQGLNSAAPEGVYSVNAKGFVTSNASPHSDAPALTGQSLELLPELHERGMVVAGKFRVDREGTQEPGVVDYSGTFYVSLADDECFAITQARKESNENLFLLIIPERR